MREAMKALERIVALDPEGIRADDCGRAVRLAREALAAQLKREIAAKSTRTVAELVSPLIDQLAALSQEGGQAGAVVPLEWMKAVQEAYGWLWHVNNEPMAPVSPLPPVQAAYEARKGIRDLLTMEQRGEAINAVRGLLENKARSALTTPGSQRG